MVRGGRLTSHDHKHSSRWTFSCDPLIINLPTAMKISRFPKGCICWSENFPYGMRNGMRVFFFQERLQLKRCHPHAHELQGESFGCVLLLAGARGEIFSATLDGFSC